MYVREEKMWAGKNRFATAIHDSDPIQWDLNEGGGMTLSILTVSHCPLSFSSHIHPVLGY